jgi:hypothetical protein
MFSIATTVPLASAAKVTGKAGAAGAAGSADFFRKSKKPIVKLSFISPVRRAYL